MITNKELNAVKLSPTKKDFYQIWNELLDTAGKISERWDPVSTNESDPGIVLLKVLTAIADKLNYNIDANTLEAFMPSAAQEESMRKLTEMLGYDMKYYQSATTEIKISYNKNIDDPIVGTLVIDRFTNIKDVDDSINYITLTAANLSADTPFANVDCIEGELVECETDDNNVVSMFHLDDNKRYYLPETQIAENNIFVSSIENTIEGENWKKVSNLNAQAMGSKVFKFGFDSQEGLPYLQFPEDISTIIEDGLRIRYIRTSGANGNISVNTLSKLTTPASWTSLQPEQKKEYHNVENYSVANIRAATNGTNKEGINAAYNNFKKTVGTFDTLVTCRDYMNKIYSLVSGNDGTTPLVSNVIVSDLKDDINRAVTLGTFTSRGIEYKIMAKPGKKLTHFDLMLYPFKSIYGLNSKQEFNKSFNYDNSNVAEILSDLEDNKTLSHNFISPESNELACIKNYYRIRAKVNTIRKVGVIEQASILNNIYAKLFENFNMRQLDFGEEIPYDTLLKVIETADPRIKNISLDDPTITTAFLTADNKEYSTEDNAGKIYYNSAVLGNVLAGRVPLFNYNTNFKTNFEEKAYTYVDGTTSYAENYPNSIDTQKIYKLETEFNIPIDAVKDENTLTLTENEVIQFRAPSFKTTVTYPAYVNYYLCRDKTGTNYVQSIPATMQTLADFLKGGPGASADVAEAAMNFYINETNFPTSVLLTELAADSDKTIIRTDVGTFTNQFNTIVAETCAIFRLNTTNNKYEYMTSAEKAWNDYVKNEVAGSENASRFYTLAFNKDFSESDGIGEWTKWLVSLSTARLDHTDELYGEGKTASGKTKQKTITLVSDDNELKGFYKITSGSNQVSGGKLIDDAGNKYSLVENYKIIAANPFKYYYVPRIWSETKKKEGNNVQARDWHTKNGLGQDAIPFTLTKGVEYELGPNEYLLINYTQTKEGSSDEKEEICKTYTGGTIIKPNFAIADSEDWYNSNHSYTKLNVASKFSINNTLPGMFTLGTDEQIEIREIMQVELDNKNTNLYWEIPSLVSTQGNYLEFPWDEEPIHPTTGARITNITENMTEGTDYIFSAYTLKEGEYLYYTDINKSDIAFYGFGSTIRRKHNTPIIYKYSTEDAISSEEIASQGLSSSIYWRNYDLSGSNKSITITENQFINLVEGDRLDTLVLSEGTVIDNNYKKVNSASFTFAASTEGSQGTYMDLPNISLENSNFKWQVRSKLNLSVGPNKTQTLKTKFINDSEELVVDKVTLKTTTFNAGVGTDSIIKTLTALKKKTASTNANGENITITEYMPLSIKTNKIIQSATTVTDVTDKELAEDGTLSKIEPNLQLKVFELDTIENNLGNSINLGNYGDGNFTTVNFEEQRLAKNASENARIEFKLNILVPTGNFGLLMIYYQNLNSDSTAKTHYPTVETTGAVLSRFNESANPTLVNSISLLEGINVIKIDSNAQITIKNPRWTVTKDGTTTNYSNNKCIITFGDLSLIDSTNPLNDKLVYNKIENGSATAYTQILSDIRAIDNVDSNGVAKKGDFFYNIPIAGNLDIDMNPKDQEDTLKNPLNWFNYNNINNKFVIAEIDTKYLSDDIVIARSSRSNF